MTIFFDDKVGKKKLVKLENSNGLYVHLLKFIFELESRNEQIV